MMTDPTSTTQMTGMRWIPGGRFAMGSDRFYPEEAPVRQMAVEPFWIDETPVTNAEFGTFVAATGYVTTAEMAPDPRHYPDLSAALAHPGSAVFEKTSTPVKLDDPGQWWQFRLGADWRHPLGPESSIEELADHPVVHVSLADAEAFAAWIGKTLPTEAEWEFAARGGLDGYDFAWGEELAPQGAMLANYWQGLFPFANQKLDGWERTSPVRWFCANNYGVFDLIGNVWEWTADRYAAPAANARAQCCSSPRGKASTRPKRTDMNMGVDLPQHVVKGGSHLCAANYCQRYRPAARHPQTVDSSTSHIGFRCVVRK